MTQRAFILRITPGGVDKMSTALQSNEIIIGWAAAPGLIASDLNWESFREVIRRTFYANEHTLHKAGSAAGHMWRFIREMSPGDLVVVPRRSEFFVAEVKGPCTYSATNISDDSAYRRSVCWLNNQEPLPRSLARSALISRMKVQGTTAGATDLLYEIQECVSLSSVDKSPTFRTDLQALLVTNVLTEIQTGRMDSYGFESLIKDVLLSLGAVECYVVPRNSDKGADLMAVFRVAGAFQQRIAVQAKHWRPHPPVDSSVVEQLIRGIEAEGADLGMVITSGTISDEAVLRAQQYFEEQGKRIELIDGEQFAKLIVENGFSKA